MPAPGDQADVYQVKRFSANLTGKQKDQIKGSYDRLVQTVELNGLSVRNWYLTLPLDPTPENLTWLNVLTANSPFKCDWRGLTFIDGLAAEYPQVIDYYWHDGADRIARVVQDLTALLSRRTPKDSESTGLLPKDVESDLRNIYRALNEHDPHYRYSFRVDDRPPPIADEPGLVVAKQVISDGICVTNYVYALYDEATIDQPILLHVRILASPGSDLASDLDSFSRYGTKLAAPATLNVQIPGGLGEEDAMEGRILVTPLGSEGAQPYVIRLQLIDDSGVQLALVTLNMQPVTQGPSGLGLRGHGQEQHGVFEFEIRTDLESGEVHMKFTKRDLKGLSPSTILPGLHFLQAFHAPHLLRVGAPFGPLEGDAEPLTSDGLTVDVAFEIAACEALAALQTHTTHQLSIPDIDSFGLTDIEHWRRAANLLAGETVEVKWNRWEFTIQPDKLDLLQVEHGFMLDFSTPLMVRLGDQDLPLGTQETVIMSAQLDPSQPPTVDGELLRVRVIPAAHSDEARLSLGVAPT